MFNGINFSFTLILFALFFISLVIFIKNGKTKLVQDTPTLLTSIGIFGTFFGIVSALLGFDGVDNIKEQIDVIISGMQTAFVTSVLGLFLSIIFKIIIILKKDDDNDADNVTGEELINHFLQQTEHTAQLVEKLDSLVIAIGQDGEKSLLGQVRLLRMDFSDYQKQQLNLSKNSLQLAIKSYKEKEDFEQKLWQEMDTVTQTLAKSATETIIKALKDVITDFNNNLTEQFGENFKELNNAVFELVTWQENYKQQIADMTEQYELGVQAVNNTKNAVASIEKSSQAIPQLIDQLGLVIDDNQNKLDELSNHLQAFADIREKAVEALPQIQSHIELVLDNMEQGTHQIKDTMINIAHDFNNDTADCLSELENTSNIIANRTKEINQSLQHVVDNIEQEVHSWLKNFETSLQKLQGEFEKTLASMTNEQKEFMRIQMRDLVQNIEKIYREAQEDINKSLKSTQENMAKIQEKSISDMGTSLVNITGQFANDYTRLTNEMDKVIRQNKELR